MHEQRERRALAGVGQEQIDGLPRRVAVGQAELRAVALERFDAIVFRVAHIAGENLQMVGHARAIIVLGFVIDGGHRDLRRIDLSNGAAAFRGQACGPQERRDRLN